MSDNNSNVFKCGNDTYMSKDALESDLAQLVGGFLIERGLSTAQCGEKTLPVRVEITLVSGRGRPLGSKNAPKDGSAGPKLTGTHYVAKDLGGFPTYVHIDNVDLATCAALYEFRTKDGALYAIDHETVADRTPVWERPAPSVEGISD